MRLLPILWGSPPTPADWERLAAARVASGHTEKIKPARALPGSPGPILAIGAIPHWLVEHRAVESTKDPRLQEQLTACLAGETGETSGVFADLLSSWMGEKVTYVEEVPHDD